MIQRNPQNILSYPAHRLTDRQTERQTNKHRSKSITYNEMDWEKITQNIKYKQTKKENVKSSGKLQPNLVGFTIICFL